MNFLLLLQIYKLRLTMIMTMMIRMMLRIHIRRMLGASSLYLMAGTISFSNLILTGTESHLGGTPES